MIAPVDEVIE